MSEPEGASYCKKENMIFKNFLDAVFLAGLEPKNGWFDNSNDTSAEVESELREITADNLSEDPWSSLVNPTVEEYEKYTTASSGRLDQKREELPNLRIGNSSKAPTRKEQEFVMQVVSESENYLEVIEKIEETDISDTAPEKILDPGANPDDGGSVGRWMSQEEFLDNAPMIVYGNDPRPDPK